VSVSSIVLPSSEITDAVISLDSRFFIEDFTAPKIDGLVFPVAITIRSSPDIFSIDIVSLVVLA